MKKAMLLVAAASMFGGSAALAQNSAQPAKPAAKQPAKPADKHAEATPKAGKLAVGDKAPEFKVEKFVKGKEVTGFEKGHFYVVEFWATWCGPCKEQFPHMSAMQKEYEKKNVTFIGVNVWEDKTYDAGTLTKVEKFVKDQGDKMSYTVAYDGKEKHMDKAWMQAAGREGIPSAFLVDGDGKIAWIGHPGELEPVLAKAVGGKAKDKDAKKKKDEDATGHAGN